VVLWLGDVFGCYKFTCKGFEGRQTTVELEDNKVVVWGTELSDSTAIAITIDNDQICHDSNSITRFTCPINVSFSFVSVLAI